MNTVQIIIILVIVAGITLLAYLNRKKIAVTRHVDARELAKERLSRGDISREEDEKTIREMDDE